LHSIGGRPAADTWATLKAAMLRGYQQARGQGPWVEPYCLCRRWARPHSTSENRAYLPCVRFDRFHLATTSLPIASPSVACHSAANFGTGAYRG